MHALFYRHGPLSGSDAFSSLYSNQTDAGWRFDVIRSKTEEMKDYEQA